MTEQTSSSIKISVLTCNGAAPGNVAGTEFGGEFGSGGGTIGNGAGNALVLPDDTGGVAAHHADLRCVAGGWRMRNISERGTLTVNGKPLTPGGDMRVGVGDFIGLGPYVLRVAPGLVAPDWQASAAPARVDGAQRMQAAAGPDGLSLPHREAGPLSDAPSAGWLSDGTTLLESPIAFGDLTDLPVDPLALFGSVNRAWPGAHNPQAADLFGEEVGPTSRADAAPAPREPQARAGERRNPTELNSAFTMRMTTPMPDPRDEGLRMGPDDAPAVAPLSREAFEAHSPLQESDNAATANAAGDQRSNDAPYHATAEQARVPMKVRYDTHFGASLHDVTPVTLSGQLFRFDAPEPAAAQAFNVPPVSTQGERAAESAATLIATPGVATPAAPAEPKQQNAGDSAGDSRVRSAGHHAPKAADDRFAALRASFPTASTAAARFEDGAAPAPVDVIASLASHCLSDASGAQPLPTTPEDTVSDLIAAFFAGAGIAAHDAAAAGLDTEFMYMLGGVARTLLGKRTGSS